jgi:hypothetical protein
MVVQDFDPGSWRAGEAAGAPVRCRDASAVALADGRASLEVGSILDHEVVVLE